MLLQILLYNKVTELEMECFVSGMMGVNSIISPRESGGSGRCVEGEEVGGGRAGQWCAVGEEEKENS